MNIYRMTMMAEMLEEIVEGTWEVTTEGWVLRDDPVEFAMADWVDDTGPCGYSACAVGHALMDKRFSGDGFGDVTHYGMVPTYEGDTGMVYRGWGAVERYFEISDTTAQDLFDKWSYEQDPVHPHHVARRVREYIAREQDNA